MLTTVIVGNSNTFVREGLMVTPRGYANKYTIDTNGSVAREGEQSGRSLTMGLIGWKAHARAWLRADTARTLRDATRHFDMPLGELLSATTMHVADEASRCTDEAPCPWQSVEVAPAAFIDALKLASQWGRLRAVVRNDAGSVAELLIDDAVFERKGDWLNLVTDNFHLHVPWNRVHAAWITAHQGDIQGLYCCDAHGEPLLTLQPTGQRPRFDRVQLATQLDLLTPEIETQEEDNSDDE